MSNGKVPQSTKEDNRETHRSDVSIDDSVTRRNRIVTIAFSLTMSHRNRSRDVSSEDAHRSPSTSKQPGSESRVSCSSNKRPSTFNKAADIDDPPFSRLFLLIPKDMSEDELRQAFQVHGSIQDIHMVRDRRNQESKGIAYVKYEKASAAARAMEEMNGTVISPHIRPVKVTIDRR